MNIFLWSAIGLNFLMVGLNLREFLKFRKLNREIRDVTKITKDLIFEMRKNRRRSSLFPSSIDKNNSEIIDL